MKAIKLLVVSACAVLNLFGMPTEAEARRAEPVVRTLLRRENAALKAGKLSRSEVADSAMRLADKADDEASKLLFMKGAFVLYARDGKAEKAVETLDKIESLITDVSVKNIANMIDLAISDKNFNTDKLADCKALLIARRDGRRHPDGVQLWEDGPYWSECNVGATKPEGSGYCFWWGDTVGYEWDGEHWNAEDGSKTNFVFSFDTPTWGKSIEQLKAGGFIDSMGNLSAAHDAATSHLGAPWRMPTHNDLAMLIEKCDTEWTSRNGVEGILVKGKGEFASRSIFIPDAGFGLDAGLGKEGHCMSSTPNPDGGHFTCMKFNGSAKPFLIDFAGRNNGLPVRPVRDASSSRRRGGLFGRKSDNTINFAQHSDGVQLWKDGPYWAKCNVGANKPEEYGEFFWWGDTSRTGYSTDKCQTFNKNRDQLRSEGYIDTTSNLAPEHDTATAYLGSSWRMPTDEEFMALMRNCDVALTKQNGVCGLLVAGRGEFAYKSIFLPSAGLRCGTDYSFKGVYGGCWASTPNMDEGDHDWIPRCARHFAFDKGAVNCYNDNRYVGHSVRAVRNDK